METPEVFSFVCDQHSTHAMTPRIQPMRSHLKLELPLVEATKSDHKDRRRHQSEQLQTQVEPDCPAQLEERELSSDAPDALR